MAGHTCGPWHVEIEGVVTDCEYGLIADCSCRNHITVKSRLTAQANARLIATAPDMLAVLEKVAAWEADPDRYAGDLADIAHEARAAIAKARTGE